MRSEGSLVRRRSIFSPQGVTGGPTSFSRRFSLQSSRGMPSRSGGARATRDLLSLISEGRFLATLGMTVFLSVPLAAQRVIVSGVVRNGVTGDPIVSAVVRAAANNVSTITDDDGR